MEEGEIAALDELLETGIYARKPISLVRGLGARLWDAAGNEYIDAGGGNYGAANVGHCNPEVVKAIRVQSEKLIFAQSSFPNDARALCMKELLDLVPKPLTRVFLCNSGTESMEAAIKFARGTTGRREFIAMENAFHGRTFGALSATWKPDYRKPFEPLVPGFSHIPFGDTKTLKKTVSSDTAAVIVEPIQGEGGVRVPPEGYLRDVRDICDSVGALMIVDEIQTGFCRTGRMFCFEHFNVVPDILCLGKSIAGGLPMGATVVRDDIKKMQKGSHGTTFGGNPVVCAASTAAIRYMRSHGLESRAAELGGFLRDRLNNLGIKSIVEVRGMGLMVGVELDRPSQPVVLEMIKHGIIPLQTGKNVIRFLPPIVIEKKDLEDSVSALASALV